MPDSVIPLRLHDLAARDVLTVDADLPLGEAALSLRAAAYEEERGSGLAGARATALESRVFGTRYAVLSLPCGGTVPDAALCKELRALYKTMIPQPYYRGNVIFYGN